MKCPKCHHAESKVNDSRALRDAEGIRRRRECLECGHRFTTFERIENELPVIVKSDGRREAFDRDKMYRGIRIACEKRPISVSRIEKLVDKIEADLAEKTEKEIPSSALGDIVISELRELDQVAYVRFASVYREFQDVEAFIKEITTVLRPSKGSTP